MVSKEIMQIVAYGMIDTNDRCRNPSYPMRPSQHIGVNENSLQDVFDKRCFTAGRGETLLNDTIFMYNNTHHLINIKCLSHHCKRTTNFKDFQVDEFTKAINEFTKAFDVAQLKKKFERMYMLDPDIYVSKYGITYNKICNNCYHVQYVPPFKLTYKDVLNRNFL